MQIGHAASRASKANNLADSGAQVENWKWILGNVVVKSNGSYNIENLSAKFDNNVSQSPSKDPAKGKAVCSTDRVSLNGIIDHVRRPSFAIRSYDR